MFTATIGQSWSSWTRTSRPLASVTCVCGSSMLPHLNQRYRLLRVARNRQLRGQALRRRTEGLRRRRSRFSNRDRYAGVAAHADRLVDRNAAEEWELQIVRQRFAATRAEDVGLVPAARADEVAHVLDEAERRHVQLLIHPDGPQGVGERHGLRCGDDHGPR